MHFQTKRKRAFKLFSYLIASIIFISMLVLPTQAASRPLAIPSNPSYAYSQVRWYSPSDYLAKAGGYNVSASLFQSNPPANKLASIDVFSTMTNAVDISSLADPETFSYIPTASWWNEVDYLEYTSYSLTTVASSYNTNTANIVFWFSKPVDLKKGEQAQLWLSQRSIIYQTSMTDYIASTNSAITPYLYTVSNVDTGAGYSISNKFYEIVQGNNGWSLYQSQESSADCYILGIGFIVGDSGITVPANYKITAWFDFTSMFVGKINQYFTGLTFGDFTYHEPEIGEFFPDLEANENEALNSWNRITNLFENELNVLGQNLETAHLNINTFISVFCSLPFITSLVLISSMLIIYRAVIGR